MKNLCVAAILLLGGCAYMQPAINCDDPDWLRCPDMSGTSAPAGNTDEPSSEPPSEPPSGGKSNRGHGNGNENSNPHDNGRGNTDSDNPGKGGGGPNGDK